MKQDHSILFDDKHIHWQDIVAIAKHNASLELSDDRQKKLRNARNIVDKIVESGDRAYGISTGLGALCSVTISREQQSTLSTRVLLSHACGVGESLGISQTRAIMACAIANFSKGHSGISPSIVELLIHFLNNDITPDVPKQGSVGYLTHMAHIGICLIGIGEVIYKGERTTAKDAIAAAGLKPVTLGAKDGLSLVNGTPCMTGLACIAIDDCQHLAQWADLISAMSFEALGGQISCMDDNVMQLKPYPGQINVANNMRAFLNKSQVIENRQGIRTQDALSLRSIPQIHGACRDQIEFASKQILIELNSATDNPLVMGTPDDYQVISQANPHGEAISMACDQLAIAIHEFSSVAERRSDRLVNPLVSGLPAFLVADSGVNSGMMIAQYVSASLVSENRRHAQPVSTDNFVTSALQEDHLSMGTSSALRLYDALDNSFRVLAIEYLFAAQAFEFFKDESFGEGTSKAWSWLRQHIAPYHEDRWLSPEIERCHQLIRQHKVEQVTKPCNLI